MGEIWCYSAVCLTPRVCIYTLYYTLYTAAGRVLLNFRAPALLCVYLYFCNRTVLYLW